MMDNNKYQICVISDAGRARTNNEDNYVCFDSCMQSAGDKQDRQCRRIETDGPFILAVFDGIGGLKAGEVAAFKAAKELSTGYGQDWYETDSMESIIQRLNTAVCEETPKIECGCTAVLCRITEHYFYIANVGDSRAYLYRPGSLEQISFDHTETNSMLALQKEMGVHMDLDLSRTSDALTQYLGVEESEFVLEPFLSGAREWKKGDIILLCSDGLTTMVSDEDIEEILESELQLQDKLELLVEEALENGGKDNITVIVAEKIS